MPLIIYLVTTQASEFVLCNCNEFFSLTYKQIQKTTIFIPKNMNNLEKKTVKKNVALEKVWFNCKNKIANSINSSEKEAWLDSINLIELGSEQMVLGGLNNFFCNWIKNNRANLLKKSLFNSFYPFGLEENFQLVFQVEKKTIENNSLNSDNTFEGFVNGDNSSIAYACAFSIAESLSSNLISKYNPLFLYGDVGLGKTHLLQAIGKMSCNPAIGGVGKGHLVKEIDALGGVMGFIADETAIQFRKLNTKKGVAVQATRCQSDMRLYNQKMIEVIKNCPNLFVKEGEVISFVFQNNKIQGVKTSAGESLLSKAVVLTGGTFLRGKIHIGDKQMEAGRAGELPANQLSCQLEKLGLKMGRLKTGTTPRLDKNTIDFEKLQIQKGDKEISKFSFWNSQVFLPQLPCYITYTNKKTHKIIADNIQFSSVYNGSIQSSGPRYCPSIEDKIVRFSDKDKHQIFLEPTSLDSIEIYPNGISTSLPEEVQRDFVHSIKGLEKAKIIRAGYAVEYDYVFPQQLKLSLELKCLEGLFLAGQINGTTGYEEAAAQGLMAGINAALKIQNKKPLVLTRDVSYIAVLIDDLVTKGTEEPYRMFTSRCRISLVLYQKNERSYLLY